MIKRNDGISEDDICQNQCATLVRGVKAEGINIGEMRMLVKQVRKGRVTIEEAAEDAGMTVEEFKKGMENTSLQAV